jgi:hypothetical protein
MAAGQNEPFPLNSATIGRLYAYTIETSRPARFTKVTGNADWLTVTPDGVLTGKPAEDAPPNTEITVEASWQDKALQRSFTVPVNPAPPCALGGTDEFHWCEPDNPTATSDADCKPPGRPAGECRFAIHASDAGDGRDVVCSDVATLGCIVQFSRTIGKTGKFGHFTGNRVAVDQDVTWDEQPESLVDAVIESINASKVLISGSVVFRTDVENCAYWSWSVVAQTTDSSNILVYGPSEVSSFCVFPPRQTTKGTALIVLPAHAVWANVFGNPANTNDPFWKPTPTPSRRGDCWSGEKDKDTESTRGIVPCDRHDENHVAKYDDEKSNGFTRLIYQSPVAWLYNRLTQPGVSQGSLSFTPFALGIKQTWDVQTYSSTRLGPGWIGLPFTYEFDHTQRDNLDSLTAAITYDLRFDDKRQYWFAGGPIGCGRNFVMETRAGLKNCQQSTAWLLVRPIELSLRYGPEWAPSKIKCSVLESPCPVPYQRPLRDLNLVEGATLRLPIIVNPIRASWAKQPGQFSIVPVTGIEAGNRVDGHPISTGFIDGTPTAPAGQPRSIFRWVAGADGSVRWPYNFTRNFLGDRPLLVDFSYRMRWLYMDEPFSNLSGGIYKGTSKLPELQFPGGRSYTRVTFIAPFSAYLQMRLSWQHGSLPPAFQFVDSEVTLGITFANPGTSER